MGREEEGKAYDDSDDGVVVGIVDVVGEAFYDVEQVDDEVVVN